MITKAIPLTRFADYLADAKEIQRRVRARPRARTCARWLPTWRPSQSGTS